ncbi:MAG: hypothetical protein LAN61_00540 [Acidobacteriia bacterium]|nr:hypothetical protein [Terriglobia bacterium]
MHALRDSMQKRFGQAALAAAVLGGFFLFAGAGSAQAHDRTDCQRRVQRAAWKLEIVIERHGYYSRQANHWRHELREERERCWQEQERRREEGRRRHHGRDWDDGDRDER